MSCNFRIVVVTVLMLVALTASSVVSRGGANERVPGTTVEILTPTQGVNFTGFVQSLFDSVKQSWYAKIPDEAKTQKQNGKVLIRFVVRRDGSLEKGSPLLVTGSGTRNLDDAALSAIKDAAPLGGFPQEFAGSNIELEFRFYYNLPTEAAKDSASHPSR
jgi:TonB family protein